MGLIWKIIDWFLQIGAQKGGFIQREELPFLILQEHQSLSELPCTFIRHKEE